MASKTQYYWTQMIFLSHNHLLNIFIQQVSSNKNSTKLSNFITLYISIILQKYNFILKSNIINSQYCYSTFDFTISEMQFVLIGNPKIA